MASIRLGIMGGGWRRCHTAGMKRGRGARECWRLRGGGRVIGEAGSGGARDWRIGVGSIVVDGIGGREDGSSGKSRQGEINRCA